MKQLAWMMLSGLLWPILTIAQTRYVDDTLYLGVYQDKDDQSQQIAVTVSGAKLTVLKEEGAYTLVRTEKGTEGWVHSKYLVESPPSVVRIKQLEETLQNAQQPSKELAELRAQNLQLKKQIAELKEQNTAASQQNLYTGSGVLDESGIESVNRAADQATLALNKLKNNAQIANNYIEHQLDQRQKDRPRYELVALTLQGAPYSVLLSKLLEQVSDINETSYVLIFIALLSGILLTRWLLLSRLKKPTIDTL